MPQRLAIIGPGNSDVTFSTDKYECEGSAVAVAEKYGYGSPLHLAALQLFPKTGNGASFPVTIYPVADGDGAVAATGSVAISGTATENGSGKIYIGGIAAEFAISKGETAADVMAKVITAINGVLEMPVNAGVITDDAIPLTAKFKGTIGNTIKLVWDCDVAGLTFSVIEMSSGAVDGNVDNALAAIGSVWETVVLDLFPYNNITNLFFQ